MKITWCSNCTLLELKRGSAKWVSTLPFSSNCTLLELKRHSAIEQHTPSIVRIAPYWN